MLMEKKWGTGNLILPNLFHIGASGVDLFFVISGFIMVIVTRGRFQKRGTVVTFLYNRISRIYPLYWFYSFILLCVFIFRPQLINPTMGNQVNLLESFLLLPQKILPLLMVGWPLVHEMYFYLIFAFILMAPEKHLTRFLFCWGMFVIIGFTALDLCDIINKNAYLMIIFHPLTLEFILGCCIACLVDKGTVKLGFFFFSTGVLILALISLMYYHDQSIPIYDKWARILFFGFPYSLIVYGSATIENSRKKIKSNHVMVASIYSFLRKTGDQSYSIYLSHTLVINGIGLIWMTFFMTMDKTTHILWIAVMLVSSVITGHISFTFLETPIVKLAKKYSAVFLKQTDTN